MLEEMTVTSAFPWGSFHFVVVVSLGLQHPTVQHNRGVVSGAGARDAGARDS